MHLRQYISIEIIDESSPAPSTTIEQTEDTASPSATESENNETESEVTATLFATEIESNEIESSTESATLFNTPMTPTSKQSGTIDVQPTTTDVRSAIESASLSGTESATLSNASVTTSEKSGTIDDQSTTADVQTTTSDSPPVSSNSVTSEMTTQPRVTTQATGYFMSSILHKF